MKHGLAIAFVGALVLFGGHCIAYAAQLQNRWAVDRTVRDPVKFWVLETLLGGGAGLLLCVLAVLWEAGIL
jgi:hypothetical protein